jgi:predicted dehydrogenase
VERLEPLAAEIDAFLTVVRTGSRPVVDVEDGLWAVAIANALLESAALRHPVDLTHLSARLPVASA